MAVADRVVDLGREDILVAVGDAVEENLAARVVGSWQVLRQLDRRGRKEARVDLIAHKWRFQRNRAAGVARRRGEVGEIALEHRRRRDELERGRWHLPDPG